MARWRIFIYVLAVVVAAAGFVSTGIRPAKEQEEKPSSEISELLQGIFVPEVEMRSQTIEQVVEQLNGYAAALERFRNKRPFVLWKKGDPIPLGMQVTPRSHSADQSKAVVNGTDSEKPAGASEAQTATAFLSAISVYDAARYITGLVNHVITESGENIVVYRPGELIHKFATREVFLLFPEQAEDLGVPVGSTSQRVDVQAALESHGVRFYPGSFAYYEPGDMRLVVCTTSDQVDDAISSASRPSAPTRWGRMRVRVVNYWEALLLHLH